MFVIISHDVDHLFSRDHWFRDFYYPKLWVRTTKQLCERKISRKEWQLRIMSCFRKNNNNLEALMDFDESHGIRSTFFFGMNQGLGMSYKPEEAKDVIQKVHKRGFAVGVHGIDYQDSEIMKKEHDTFKQVVGIKPCGIRMHYVRFDKETFNKLNSIGYSFDTTEFDKKNNGTRKAPYKVGNMWEFPLTIMDVYLPQTFEEAKNKTLLYLEQCKDQGLQYITILFHDCYFCEDYQDLKRWYEWLIEYFSESTEYMFSSYEQVMKELDRK